MFAIFKNLKILNLSGNNITYVNIIQFCELDKLVELDLSNNNISYFEVDSNDILPSLGILKLHSNKIRFLPSRMESFLSKLKLLTIHDNPLHINCEMRWFVQMVTSSEEVVKKKLVEDLDEVMFVTPKRVSLTKTKNENFACLPPSVKDSYHEEFNINDRDVLVLTCQIISDPASTVLWLNESNEMKPVRQVENLNAVFDNHVREKSNDSLNAMVESQIIFLESSFQFLRISKISLTSAGNYTCVASNVAGTVKKTFDTDAMLLRGGEFQRRARKKVELLTSFEGALLAAFLLAILAYLIKKEM
ncbi:hypothetical protein HELRODRAFT_101569 [Helobdella robusta]|uniref:Ig-like domain-containing protein n=1 Tax=Helobdella robusta TaxID=6412 RepID=T1ED55_HELRO|nr:hypothetical protein HELRODRAFT_101569 [Helobdella robusta]ESN99617.1 hypothetical protein HELRODRAFT_101569 [Helobdella robusta]